MTRTLSVGSVLAEVHFEHIPVGRMAKAQVGHDERAAMQCQSLRDVRETSCRGFDVDPSDASNAILALIQISVPKDHPQLPRLGIFEYFPTLSLTELLLLYVSQADKRFANVIH